MRVPVLIGFGSNLGNLNGNFQRARVALHALATADGVTASRLYLSEPMTRDGAPQAWYLNAVFGFNAVLGPRALFDGLKEIERTLGRTHARKWAPRVIDLDILFYGDTIYADDSLRVPHPGLALRRFVLVPLADVAPSKRHPEFGMTVAELLSACRDPLSVMPCEHQVEEVAVC